MLRTAVLILSGNAAASLLLLARNLIVARLIPVSDYGIASTFAMAMAVVEMASAFGLQQQIIQAKEGDDPRFQAALQGFQLLRGVISGMILFVIAGPLARFLGIPEVIWAYQILALVPVMNGLQHFDIHRMNRHMRFGPMLWTGALPALISLLAVWPFVHWFGNWQVMLWVLMAQAVLSVATSHLVAERPYRLVLDRKIMANSFRFGWPLLINAALMFLVFQGDKVIVGRLMGMEALAIYSMGVTLTLTPTLVMAKSAQNLFLPRLSAAVGQSYFMPLVSATLQTIMAACVAFGLGTLVLGAWVVHLLLGTKYAQLEPLILWFALGQTLRVLKAGPAIIALSIGRTGNAMIANLPRVLVLPLCWALAQNTGDLRLILIVALAGETLGFVVSFWLLRKQIDLGHRSILVPYVVGSAILASLGMVAWAYPTPPLWATLTGSALALAACLATMPQVMRYLRRSGS